MLLHIVIRNYLLAAFNVALPAQLEWDSRLNIYATPPLESSRPFAARTSM
jgi:hypothetical protein